MNEAAYRDILRRLGVEPARAEGAPVGDPELARRAEAFRRQLADWTSPSIPLLILPGAPEPRVGRCLSCGDEIAEGWRCALCLRAVYAALGVGRPWPSGEPA